MDAPPEAPIASPVDIIAERESVPVAEPAAPEPTPTFVERVAGRSSRPLVPDPFVVALDNEAGVRLFENRQRRVMAIKFDERPIQPVIDMGKEAGFSWNPTDLVWTKPVRGDSALSTRIDAERLYQKVCQMIRHDKGTEAGQDIPF